MRVVEHRLSLWQWHKTSTPYPVHTAYIIVTPELVTAITWWALCQHWGACCSQVKAVHNYQLKTSQCSTQQSTLNNHISKQTLKTAANQSCALKINKIYYNDNQFTTTHVTINLSFSNSIEIFQVCVILKSRRLFHNYEAIICNAQELPQTHILL